MANETERWPNGDHERRLSVLESWRETHDIWAGQKAEKLVALEQQMISMREFRDDLKKLVAFAVVQTIAICGIIVTLVAKH